jgi:hypothetical protein
MVIDVRITEHKMAITGLYPALEIGRWRRAFLTVSKLWYIYLAVAATHFVIFAFQKYPVVVHY